MAGVSPTFFKYVGNKSGGSPTVEPFWGNGFLNLEGKESEVKIVDNPSNKGFSVVFNTNVTLEDAPGSEIVGKYRVTLDFRYAGDQINIEVQDLMGNH
jgi:type IV secretory pathway component VirB8